MASTVKDLIKAAGTAASNHQASIAAAQATSATIAAKRAAQAATAPTLAGGQSAGTS